MADFAGRTVLCKALEERGIAFRLDAPLAPLTTFLIGGTAAVLCRPADEAQTVQLMALIREAGARFYCLGRGSNTLFADEGFAGVVIDFSALDGIEVCGERITAEDVRLFRHYCIATVCVVK